MNQPPEFAPYRTETQTLGDDITQAMRNLRRDWPHMLRPGETQAPGFASRSGVTLDDHDKSDADQRRIDRTISLRRFAIDTLNAWARLIIEDRNIFNGATTPMGNNAEGMADFIERHAEWLSGHEAAQDARDELTALANRCHQVVAPTKRDWMSIGRCPLEQPLGPDAVLEECGGDVRVKPSPDQRAGEADGVCQRCGETAVASWWAERMFVNGEASPLVTIAELVAVIAYRLEIVVTHDQIRQWKHRGKIESAGTDQKGRTLYRHEDVIDSIRAEARARA